MNQNMSLNEPFDFSKYRIDDDSQENNQNIEVSSLESQAQEPFDFSKYTIKEEPSTAQEIGRGVVRTGARVAESILGFPGDVVQVTKKLGEYLPRIPGTSSELTFVQRYAQKALEALPTSEEIKKFTSYITNGFTDPQSATEELGDEIASLATILVNPSRATYSFPCFLRTLGTSIGKASIVKGAGKGAELLGASEKQKMAVELGTLFLTGLLSQKTADRFISEKQAEARSLIPEGTRVPTHGLESALTEVDSTLARGISTTTKNEVRESLRELRDKASQGTMEVDEIVQAYHDINEKLSSKKLFDELNTSERRQLKRRYDLLKDEINEDISIYGDRNREFYETWREANEGFATIAQSKNVSNFLQSKLGKLPKHLAGSIALDLFIGSPLTTIGVLGSFSAVKLGELLYRIARSPTLRDHYMKVVLEAGNENLPGVVKNLKALDKEAEKIK